MLLLASSPFIITFSSVLLVLVTTGILLLAMGPSLKLLEIKAELELH